MVATQFALDLWGYDRVVLAGVPLSGVYEGYVSAWKPLRAEFAERIRSMSGNTMKLFGQPDRRFVQ